MTFANPLPWWGVLLVLAGVALLGWVSYRRLAGQPARRVTLTALRIATLLALVLFLMRPVATARPDGRDAVVPILVDTSRSMSLGDAAGMRRIERASEMVDRLRAALGQRFRIDVLGFGDEVSPARSGTLAATAGRSDLAGALTAVRERYRGQAVPGVLLISDGGETGAAAEQAAADAGLPVFPLGVGGTTVPGDREILGATTVESVLDNAQVDLSVTAVAHVGSATPLELRLLENGRSLEVARVAPASAGVPVHHVFRISPPKGRATVYTVETPAGAGDPVPENNRRSVLVRGADRPRRILFVQGAPGFEHSFLARAWSEDAGLEIDAVARKGRNEQGRDTYYVQAARGRADHLTTGFPDTEATLFAYDAVVLANVSGDRLSSEQLEWTRDFVARRGGGLIVLGGRTFERPGLGGTPLEEVLPLYLDGAQATLAGGRGSGANRPVPTPAGAVHPIMQLTPDAAASAKKWEAMPALATVEPLGGPRPGATVLATAAAHGGGNRPLVAVQRFGEGRAFVFTGEGAWRWKMLLPAADTAYDLFWRQALRWVAVPAQDPVSITAPADAVPGASTTIVVAARTPEFQPMTDATVDLRVTRPDGTIDDLRAAAVPDRPGVWRAAYRPSQPGVHTIAADAASGAGETTAMAPMLVGGADAEMTDPRLNLALLRRVATASGGRMLEAGDAAQLAGDLEARVPQAARAAQRDLWHNGWSFAIVIALLSLEWVLRRRWGFR